MTESALLSHRSATVSNAAIGRAFAPTSYLAAAPAPARNPSVERCGSESEGEGLESTAWNLGEMVVVRCSGAQREDSRAAHATRADQMDHYRVLVSFSRDGAVVVADGVRLPLASGEPMLLDMARAAEVHLGAGTAVQAFVPREMLDELLNAPRDLHALRLVGASATVLAEHLRSLTTCLPEMTASQAPFAVTATLHMVAAALASTPEPQQAARPQVESPLLRQACRYIEMHLSEPTLSAADLCAAIHVSRATLYRLFDAYGGVSSHIRERRLARIREVLCEGRGRRSLARIAEDHGFENSAHFSRAYRQQYGHCPRDAAALAAGERKPSAQAADPGDALGQWLRALRG
ncbi:MAG: AraC family transcriptional regulator [Solirubrobacteraceae bacterium]|nr:AraC family transcriptional regulator [Solirubrobacteraceae bacterium]